VQRRTGNCLRCLLKTNNLSVRRRCKILKNIANLAGRAKATLFFWSVGLNKFGEIFECDRFFIVMSPWQMTALLSLAVMQIVIRRSLSVLNNTDNYIPFYNKFK
jgi:hypothetical protein